MQVIVSTVNTQQNIGSSFGETALSNLNEDKSCSQETPTDLTLTKLDPGKERDDSERKKSLDMKTRTSRSKVKGSRFFQLFRKKKTTKTWQWKSCEVVLLALATAVTISINAVPAIVYFTLEVSIYRYIFVHIR